jgi:hypothetical protein
VAISRRRYGENTPASFYLVEKKTSNNGQPSAFFRRMTTASARIRLWPLVGAVLTSIALATGICQSAGAANLDFTSDRTLIQVQYSMGQPGPAPGARPRQSPPTQSQGLTPKEQKGFAEAMKRMKSKDRKRLTKAMKRFTPEESRQFIGAVKRQLAANGTPHQPLKRAR